MTQQMWNELSFFEQLSNVDGDVERLIRSHENFLCGKGDKDNSDFYLSKIEELINMTFLDDKNKDKDFLAEELYDEVEEIRQYLAGKCSADYIRSYWNAYTNAL